MLIYVPGALNIDKNELCCNIKIYILPVFTGTAFRRFKDIHSFLTMETL